MSIVASELLGAPLVLAFVPVLGKYMGFYIVTAMFPLKHFGGLLQYVISLPTAQVAARMIHQDVQDFTCLINPHEENSTICVLFLSHNTTAD